MPFHTLDETHHTTGKRIFRIVSSKHYFPHFKKKKIPICWVYASYCWELLAIAYTEGQMKYTVFLDAFIMDLATSIKIIAGLLSRASSPSYSTIFPISNANCCCKICASKRTNNKKKTDSKKKRKKEKYLQLQFSATQVLLHPTYWFIHVKQRI